MKFLRSFTGRLACLVAVVCLPVVSARGILGVDLGSLYMKVALVQSGAPLEIVTNLHSKRKTEQMILFDRGQRFYGADANSLLARKSHLTPAAMSLLLGRDDQHPAVKVRLDGEDSERVAGSIYNSVIQQFLTLSTGPQRPSLPTPPGLQREPLWSRHCRQSGQLHARRTRRYGSHARR